MLSTVRCNHLNRRNLLKHLFIVPGWLTDGKGPTRFLNLSCLIYYSFSIDNHFFPLLKWNSITSNRSLCRINGTGKQFNRISSSSTIDQLLPEGDREPAEQLNGKSFKKTNFTILYGARNVSSRTRSILAQENWWFLFLDGEWIVKKNVSFGALELGAILLPKIKKSWKEKIISILVVNSARRWFPLDARSQLCCSPHHHLFD